MDWKEFKELPYKRNGKAEDIIPFWKYVIRGLGNIDAEARRYKQDRRRPTMKDARAPHQRKARILPYSSRNVRKSDKVQGFKAWKTQQLKAAGFSKAKYKKAQQDAEAESEAANR